MCLVVGSIHVNWKYCIRCMWMHPTIHMASALPQYMHAHRHWYVRITERVQTVGRKLVLHKSLHHLFD